MLLTDLNPNFVNAGGEGISNAQGQPVPLQEGVGMSFNCPCGCKLRCYVDFKNPLDGSRNKTKAALWSRTGEDFATMSLHPSIQRRKVNGIGCEWHGWIKEGEVTEA